MVGMSLMRIAGVQVQVVDLEQGRMARPRVLPPGQRVDVWLEMDMPESNGDVFQVCAPSPSPDTAGDSNTRPLVCVRPIVQLAEGVRASLHVKCGLCERLLIEAA